MKYLIVGNGNIANYELLLRLVNSSDAVLCADGGAKHLNQINILPDAIIGDMDSIGTALSYVNVNSHFNVTSRKQTILIKYPKEKDASDTELSVLWAIDNGATYITLTGVTGNRLDHTLSNIFIIRPIMQKGVGCKIVDDNNEIYMLSHDLSAFSISISGAIGELLSIIPITEEVTGLTLRGLEYPLNDFILQLGSSKCISNVFIENTADISLKKGGILVIKSKD